MFNLKNFINCFITKKEEPLIPPKTIVEKEFENNECIICLEKMIKGEHIKILNCGHIYHEKCINEWYKKVKECPICFK